MTKLQVGVKQMVIMLQYKQFFSHKSILSIKIFPDLTHV